MEKILQIIKSDFVEEKAKCECIYITQAPKLELRFAPGKGSFATPNLLQIGVTNLLKGEGYENIYISVMHMAVHESFHYVCSNFFKLKNFVDIVKNKIKSNPSIKKVKNDKKLEYIIATTLNCIEDGRIERIASKMSPRYAYFIQNSNNFIWNKRDMVTENKSEFDDFFHMLISLSVSNSLPKNFDKKYDESSELYKLTNELYPLVRQGVKSQSFSKCLKTTEEIINKSIDYLLSIMDENDANEYEYEFTLSPTGGSEVKMPSDSDDSDSNDSDSSDSNTIDVNIPKSPKEADNDKDNKDKDNKANENLNKIKQDIEKLIKEELSKFIKEFTDELKSKEEEKRRRNEIRPINILELDDFYKEYEHSFIFHNTFEISHKIDESYLMEGKQLRTLFEEEIRKQKRTPSRRKKTGLLNSSDLYRVFLGKEDVFKQRKPKNQDIAFEIILDMSGSMYGDKFTQATKALSILEYALSGLYPTKIIGFNTSGNTTDYYLIRDFSDTTRRINYSYNFSQEESPGNCNRDGVIVAVSAKELSRRKEKQKVLIVLSDGQPNADCSRGKSAIQELKESVKKAYSLGITAVIPIYFGPLSQEYQDTFKEMYLNRNIIFCEDSEINFMLKKLLKSYLLK